MDNNNNNSDIPTHAYRFRIMTRLISATIDAYSTIQLNSVSHNDMGQYAQQAMFPPTNAKHLFRVSEIIHAWKYFSHFH